MQTGEKLSILGPAAKYDASCVSSGGTAPRAGTRYGKNAPAGICHSWSADGRCVSLLKILMTNRCIYDCAYCINRRSLDKPRATFEPRELADITAEYYRRNYIEGLFLSSGIVRSPDYTMERLLQTIQLLRQEGFGGYIHVKAIPGADSRLLEKAGLLADRMSANIELPSQASLNLLAPDKTKQAIVGSMLAIKRSSEAFADSNKGQKNKKIFAPSGQSTQVIVGASPETDADILKLAGSLYSVCRLKRVFYSAYMPVNEDKRLPVAAAPPLKREHRLYQADWLYRFYGFNLDEIIPQGNLDLDLDPKSVWAAQHPEYFPVDVMRAAKEELLRVPGIGPASATRILEARRYSRLDFLALKKLGAVMKRAAGFVSSGGKRLDAALDFTPRSIRRRLEQAGKQLALGF